MAAERQAAGALPFEQETEGEMEGVRTILQQIVSEGENGGKEDEEVEGEAAGGQQEMDLEIWYQDMESRHQQIPDSYDKYKPTCKAIERLQSLLQEVVDRQHSLLESGGQAPVDPSHLLGPLSAKQETLFQGVVHFHRLEVVRLEQSISEAERKLVESPISGGYIDQQQKLHQLRATREDLTSCEEELHSLLEGHQPMKIALGPLEQQEASSPFVSPDDSSSGVYSDLKAVHNQAEMLLLRCQDIAENLDEKIEQLENDLQAKRKRFQQELAEVESWLRKVYGLLRAETDQELRVGSSSPERELEEGVDGLGEGGTDVSDPSESYGSGEELVSDDSLESPGMEILRDREWDSPVDREILETSVDVELEDEEYSEAVIQRVISPDREERSTPLGDTSTQGERGLHPAGSTSPPNLEGSDVAVGLEQQVQDLSQVRDLSQVMESSADRLEDVRLEREETASVSSESTLRSETQRSSWSPEGASGPQEAVEIPDGGEKILKQESEPESPLPKSEGEESGPTATSSSDNQSDQLEEVLEDELQWVEGLRLAPMEVQLEEWERDQPDYGVVCNEANSIVESLESSQEQLSTFFHKVKGTMANINFVINAVSTETANELRARLAAVKQQWEPLGGKMKYRIAQLKFEMAQRETLEALHEAVQELQSQPKINLMPEEVEGYYRDCLEFFISVDTFESQQAENLAHLEATLLPLVEFPSDDHQLFRDTVDQLRQAYEAVAERLRWQMAFLTRCRSQWSSFLQQISRFEDRLAKGEDLVSRDCYGHTLQDTEKYLTEMKQLKEQLPILEADAQKMVDLGNEILQHVNSGSEAEKHVDARLSETTERWYGLVGQLDKQESEVNKVLINWKAYVNMYHGVQTFISRMGSMVGNEPLESSSGDSTLLPQYRTYVTQLKAMQVQLNRMLKISDELVANEGIGAREAIREEVKDLKIQWEPLKDNVYDSLDMLQREHNDWVKMKLRQMAAYVGQFSDIVQKEVEFVESYPLEQLLKEDATPLLREVDQLVASQDQLNQLETDCVQLEEDILERQIQQETIGHPASELESPDNAQEKRRLQGLREELQNRAESLLPLLNVFYLQLQLLQKLQEGRVAVTIAMDAVGDQTALEVTLTDTQLQISEDWFDQLLSSVDDLGDVSEEYDAVMDRELPFSAPPCAKVVEVNHLLKTEVETLKDDSDAAMVRLQLFVEWWADYTSNHSDLASWLDEAEYRLQQLVARGESTQSPLVAPTELLADMKELKEEMDEKETVMSALTATGQNIIDELESKGAPQGEIGEQLPQIKARWEALGDAFQLQLQKQEEAASRFDSFLTSFTSLLNWMSEFHSTLVDELCVQIPHKASEDTVARHKARLEEFRQELRSHTGQYESLQDEAEQWGEHLIPDDCLSELPSEEEESAPSSPGDDEPDFQSLASLLPYIRLRMKGAEDKWSAVQRKLQNRQDQLEMSLGNMAVFLEGVEELVAWIREKLQLDALSAMPPANLELLKGFQDTIQAVRVECVERDSVRLGLVRVGEGLRGQISGLNLAKVDEQLAEVNTLWKELQETLQGRGEVLGPLVSRIEAFWLSAGDLEAWLQEREAALTDCGPIGADLPRLGEQGTILETLDEEVLNKKRVPEDVFAEAMNIIKECQEGSGEGIKSKAQELQNQFDELSQRTVETGELCEEATSAIQEFKKEFDPFSQWLEGVEGKLEERRATKEPIGTITSQLEDHYDFMRENEQQTDQYSDLRSHGNKLSVKYKPSDWLDTMLLQLHQRWEDHVEQMVLRCKELLGVLELWNKYEAEVKGLLSWIMAEAESFSKEVTTERDRGISAHVKSCEALSVSMGDKKAGVGDIQNLAEVLRAEDGEKKNGTSDVESRWNDVHQHWNSLWKLLDETLLRFRATYAEVCEVLQITEEQFDWLEGCEYAAGMRQASRGHLQAVQEEIEHHQQLLEEVQAHEKEATFIRETVDFVLEHSDKSERQEIRDRADDFSERYQKLLDSLSSYVPNLQDSIPLWKEFNDQTRSMLEWLDHVQGELESNHLQPGNAAVTESSLSNAKELQRDISDHKDALLLLSALAKRLSKLVIPADQDYIRGLLEQIQFEAQNQSQRTDERTEVLYQRLRSWEVFPVAEALVVQEFLEKAQGLVEVDIEEEISAAELQERLENLESLQQLQSSNQDKVSTIDESVDSEDMKQALEKNPDISKERTNLLQGWSSMSAALMERIQLMKKRTETVTALEDALHSCSEELRAYRGVLETPLPPSVILETTQQELRETMSSLHNSCQTSLTNLSNLLDHHTTLGEVPIPARIPEQAATLNEEFQVLAGKATERTNEIADILPSWKKFQSGLQELLPWLRSSLSELSSLKAIQLFLLEFASLEGRLQTLNDEISERQAIFDNLHTSRGRHLFGEEDSVEQLQETFSRVEQGWTSLTEEVRALPEAMAPWKDLTDRFDDLSDWFDRLERKVERDFTAIEQQEVAGGDLSDFIVAMKDHLLKMGQQVPKLQELNHRADALLTPEACQQFEPARELREQCGELEGRWDRLRERLEVVLRDLQDKAARWKEEALYSMQHARQLQPRVTELTAQLEAQKELTKQLEDRVEALPLIDPREILGPKRSGWLQLLEILLLVLITVSLVLWFFLSVEYPSFHAL